MKILRNVSITKKLNLLTFLAVSAALTLCCAAFLYNDIHSLRVAKEKQISALAAVLGSNSISAMEFDDPDAAADTLASLVELPEVELAALYDQYGMLFATYPKGVSAEQIRPAGNGFMEVSHEILHSSLAMNHDLDSFAAADEFDEKLISDDQELEATAVSGNHSQSGPIGSLVIRANTNDIQKQLAARTLVAVGVLIGSLVIGVAISRIFQRSITDPIDSLVDSAKHVAKHEDYFHRTEIKGSDELGVLAETFNQMLNEVQTNREQLQKANDELEARVVIRTKELAKANDDLKNEMQERNSLQEELITASRHAGMAEVATGVLHNVGNVLNSVNVSANLLLERLQQSRVTTLSKAAEIIDEQTDRLAEFLTQDKRGQHFPTLLSELATNLMEQRDLQIEETSLLLTNIEHVKEIIGMQQAYARMRGAAEMVDVTELVEDSIRIIDTSLHRHGVNVVREFQTVREINTEKHKILQILTNLIGNAKNALDESDVEDKTITLGLCEVDSAIQVLVKDNGVGIPQENLTQIFAHGFTTRKEGHGFGLHSCALAAQELGGSLVVESEGAGQGAQFVLTIPIETSSQESANQESVAAV